MGQYEDVMVIEDQDEHDEAGYFAAIQRQINAGCWSLQGSHGRTMMGAIEQGMCLLGRNRAKDYWGNTIPARDDVMEGTKGSMQYVVDNAGQEWADQMAAL